MNLHRIGRCAAVFAVVAAIGSAYPSPALSAPADNTGPTAQPAKRGALDAELQAALAKAPDASQWPNSHYARVLDLGEIVIESDGTTVGEYRETYRLFDKAARDLAEVNLPYNSSYQTLKVVFARTIKKDGTIVPVKSEDIRQSDPYSEYLMYDDAKAIGFSMPAVEDGCIIDYKYKIVTRPLLMPGQFWTYWGFSGVEPVGTCRYTIHAPTDKPLKYKVYNNDALKPVMSTSRDLKTTTYTWTMDGIPPVAIEPSMPPVNDIRVWMEVSSLDSWQDIAKWFWSLEKPQAVPTPAIRATVSKLLTGKTTDDEKAGAIYDWVANRTRYVGLEFGLSAYKPHMAADVHDKLYGDCKDKATLLITMLGLAGIKAHPVLLHAEERRQFDSGLPTLNAFDHCIALADIGSREVWLDATADSCAYGDIPDADRGVQALVVRDGIGRFETIPPYNADENGDDTMTRISLRADGSADTTTEIKMRGDSGQHMRAFVAELTPDKRGELVRQVASRFSVGAVVKSFSLPDGTDKTGPYVLTLSLSAPNLAKKTGSLLLVPATGGGLSEHETNPFIAEKRVWPIVLQENSVARSVTVVNIPDGYTLDDLPGNAQLSCPIQSYTRTVVSSADGRTLTITDTVRQQAGTAPASEYARIRDYYDAVLKMANDEIVLKKAAAH